MKIANMSKAALSEGILEQLAAVRRRHPELRFGQLIAIVGELAQDDVGHSLWDVEDADFAAALKRFTKDMARRESTRREAAPAIDIAGNTAPPVAGGSLEKRR